MLQVRLHAARAHGGGRGAVRRGRLGGEYRGSTLRVPFEYSKGTSLGILESTREYPRASRGYPLEDPESTLTVLREYPFAVPLRVPVDSSSVSARRVR